MGTFKDIYDILKDLMTEAKRLKNQEMITLSMDLQSMFFDFKEEIEKIKDENKVLKEEIECLKMPSINEDSIEYTQNGFFKLKNENKKIPYCSACWKIDRKLVPLAKSGTWWKYSCPHCKTEFAIVDSHGNDLLNGD